MGLHIFWKKVWESLFCLSINEFKLATIPKGFPREISLNMQYFVYHRLKVIIQHICHEVLCTLFDSNLALGLCCLQSERSGSVSGAHTSQVRWISREE